MEADNRRRASGKLIAVNPTRVKVSGGGGCQGYVWAVEVVMDGKDAVDLMPEHSDRITEAADVAMSFGKLLMHSMHPKCHNFTVAHRHNLKDFDMSHMLILPGAECECAHPGMG